MSETVPIGTRQISCCDSIIFANIESISIQTGNDTDKRNDDCGKIELYNLPPEMYKSYNCTISSQKNKRNIYKEPKAPQA